MTGRDDAAPFDLAVVRARWERAARDETVAMEDRLALAREPADPYLEGRTALTRVRRLARERFTVEALDRLSPFLERADRVLAAAEHGDEPEMEIVEALASLEDVCAALVLDGEQRRGAR